ncbi:SurA N-terminal domain-containing protein [Deltaproteobacteria bacterium IMCC39524]|nr:SurA N-terminal domain-containing protein [Deltaproteobacteria bacterium IMCC39524]
MLDFVRNKQKSIIIKIAFAIIILSFVIGYAMLSSPGGPAGEDQSAEAAIVNGKTIAFNDFQTTYSNLYQVYQNIYQDQFTPALEKQLKLAEKTLDSLIDQVLLQDEAERQQIEISGKELVDAIANIPAFQENGVFSKDRYLQVLAYQRLSSEQFEAMQRSELITSKVREQLQAGVTVTDEEIDEEFRNNNEKVNLNYVSLTPASFEKKVKVTDEALATYFAEQQEVFRTPEMVSLRYLQFVPERYIDEVTFDENELEKYHRRHLDQFEILEKIKASHILIKVDEGTDETVREEKKAFAEKLLEEVKAGKDFAELARVNSDDAASAVKGGNLGYFTRGSMVKPFEQAAFNMKPGDISEVVETTFGYHIIKVEEYTEPGVRSLAESMDEVKAGLRQEKAKQLAFEKAMDAYNINRKTGDLEAAATTNELGLKESGLFARDGYIDGIGSNAEIINAAHLLEENTLAKPVATDDGIILFALKERVASHIPELDEVKDLVTASYQATEAVKLAKAAAEELVADLVDGGSLVKLAKRGKYTVEETGEFTRTYSPFVPRLGTSEELSTAAFEVKEGETAIDQLFEIQKRFVVVEVKERIAADVTLLDEAKRAELQKTILSRKQNEAVANRLEELRSAATIVIAPRIQDLLNKEK